MYTMFVKQTVMGGSAKQRCLMVLALFPKQVLALENRCLPSQIGSVQVGHFRWVREEQMFCVTLIASDFTP